MASAPSDAVRTVMNPMASGTWQLEQCAHADVRTLAEALGVSETTASVLARRGYRDAEEAQRFLEGKLPGHDPLQLGDMAAAVAAIRAAVARDARICVHGDYDADGICATALAVLLLRELAVKNKAAPMSWHLPSRFEEGYGLNAGTLTRLAEEGFDLVLTVDCGITAVAEVEHARSLGLEVVVTDHHRPADEFPACPVVAPLKGDYPFAGPLRHRGGLEARAGAARRGAPFLRPAPRRGRARDRRRRRAARRREPRARPARASPPRPDAEAGVARADARRGVDPAAVDESSVGFRLAPRINASGRLCRPEAALALLLTEDEREAKSSPKSSKD